MCSNTAHAESHRLSALVNFVQINRRLSLHALAAASLSCLPSVVVAGDRPLEPLEDPGECPIDAPLRVASVDTLRQYEGLLGHCEATSIIESPAYRANRPAVATPVRAPYPGPDLERPPHQRHDAPLRTATKSIAAASAEHNEVTPRTALAQTQMGVRAIVSPDRSNVAIVPPPSRLIARHRSEIAAQAPLDEVETILALRPQSYATAFDEQIAEAARSHGVDPLLLHAVIRQESNYRQRAVSHAGARGLMQVMPGTGRMLGVANADDLFDTHTNIAAGARLINRLWTKYDGNIDLVLAAYNAGEGAVKRFGMQVPPYRETQDYVAKVKANYALLAKESGLAVSF